MDYPLSKLDIERIFDDKIKIILYSDITNYKTIEELLYPYNRVCILYYWKKFHGHWVCVFKNKNNRVEIFDSFGSFPDGTLKDIDLNFRKETNQSHKHLTELLYRGGRSIEYNDKTLQGKKSSTCGRWCCYRMIRNDLSIEEFQDLFKNIKNNDKKIISLTNYI